MVFGSATDMRVDIRGSFCWDGNLRNGMGSAARMGVDGEFCYWERSSYYGGGVCY